MSTDELSESCKSQTTFVLGLLKTLYAKHRNLVVSPYSLVSALAMLLPGTDGICRDELLRALFEREAKDASTAEKQIEIFGKLNDANLQSNSETLKVSNNLYTQTDFPLRAEYVETLSKQFRAVGKQLDFLGANAEALKTINSDVETATKGLIEQLLQEISPATRLVLVNAIYFKGLWAAQFDKNKTNESGEFRKTNGETVQTAMMFKKKKFPFYYDAEIGAKYVQLDYKSDGNISMIFVLPDEGRSVQQLIHESITAERLHETFNKFEKFADIRLTLPRFKFSSTHYLVGPLQKLGINHLFGPSADLRKISSTGEKLFVSDVIQKAVIEVNEEGTEAAAATAIMARCLMISPEEDFTADRPFLFMLVAKHGDNARQVLFAGAIEDPSAKE